MNDSIIVALDGMPKNRALKMAMLLSGKPGLWGFKLNDLLGEYGYSVIAEIGQYGRVFADPKQHDVPPTGMNFGRKLLEYSPSLVTVHASAGPEFMMKFGEGLGGMSKVLAVTVLTSMSEEQCQLTYGGSVKATVLKFSRWAKLAGAPQVVCSARDFSVFDDNLEIKDLKKVTPAIRPLWYQELKPDFDYQRRKTTAKDAVEGGSDLQVIGTPIITAEDPVEALRLTVEETNG